MTTKLKQINLLRALALKPGDMAAVEKLNLIEMETAEEESHG